MSGGVGVGGGGGRGEGQEVEKASISILPVFLSPPLVSFELFFLSSGVGKFSPPPLLFFSKQKNNLCAN